MVLIIPILWVPSPRGPFTWELVLMILVGPFQPSMSCDSGRNWTEQGKIMYSLIHKTTSFTQPQFVFQLRTVEYLHHRNFISVRIRQPNTKNISWERKSTASDTDVWSTPVQNVVYLVFTKGWSLKIFLVQSGNEP